MMGRNSKAAQLFDGVPWTMEDQENAQLWGWELNRFESNGQICVVADEDRADFTGPRRNMSAYRHVLANASSKRPDQYRAFCRRAIEIVSRSARP